MGTRSVWSSGNSCAWSMESARKAFLKTSLLRYVESSIKYMSLVCLSVSTSLAVVNSITVAVCVTAMVRIETYLQRLLPVFSS